MKVRINLTPDDSKTHSSAHLYHVLLFLSHSIKVCLKFYTQKFLREKNTSPILRINFDMNPQLNFLLCFIFPLPTPLSSQYHFFMDYFPSQAKQIIQTFMLIFSVIYDDSMKCEKFYFILQNICSTSRLIVAYKNN